MPINQQSLPLDAVLDGSLRLLDVCTTVRDVLLQTQEHIQSVLRRRCSGELSIDNEVAQYLNARKHVKKAIKNCLRDIKTSALEGMLSNVEVITTDILKSSLTHITGSMIQSKRSSWFLVSKLIHQSGNQEQVASSSSFYDLDAAFSLLIFQKKKSGINMMQVDKLKSQMVKLESEILDLDEALECLFRRLVKTRATLLNILSN